MEGVRTLVVDTLDTWRLCPRFPDGGKWIALITGAGLGGLRIATEDGRMLFAESTDECAAMLRSFQDTKWHVFSVASPKDLARSTGPQRWTGWKREHGGTFHKLRFDGGPTVTPFRQKMDGYSDEELLSGFLALVYALESYGVMPNSIGTMSMHFWRSLLKGKQYFTGPSIARLALYGGRQECLAPGEYKKASYFDLTAAYPTAMASEPFMTKLFPSKTPTIGADGMGIAHAVVDIPEKLYGWYPIPARVNPTRPWYTYGFGKAEGWWTWRELRLAVDEGCTVKVIESWRGRKEFEVDLFADWFKEAQHLRALPGLAGKLAKIMTSQLWGKFSLRALGSSSYTWDDQYAAHERLISMSRKPSGCPQDGSTFIAADITARVRSSLWYEGLANDSAIYCDTDAVVMNSGKAPGDNWRPKLPNSTGFIEVRGPQMLRWQCINCVTGEHRPWHYIVAGASNRDAQEKVFEKRNRRIAVNPTWGITFPSENIAALQRKLTPNDDKRGNLRNRFESLVRENRKRGVSISGITH